MGEILSKIRRGVHDLRNLEFCKKSRFYPIPMGFTGLGISVKKRITPQHCLNNGKNKFYSWIKTLSGNQLQNNDKDNIKDLIKPPDGVAIL